MSQQPAGQGSPQGRLNCNPALIAHHAEGLGIIHGFIMQTFLRGLGNTPHGYYQCAQYLLLTLIQNLARKPWSAEDQNKIRELRRMSRTLMNYYVRTFPDAY